MTPFITRLLRRGPTFVHGVHPPDHKAPTAGLRTERAPFVDEYVMPLAQGIGAPSVPCVAPGQRVRRGEQLAAPAGRMSVALHAPVTGTVTAIEPRPHPNGRLSDAIVLRLDALADQRQVAIEEPADLATIGRDALLRRVQQAGIVGMGGAAFPTHVKLAIPEGKRCRFVVVNGCECEPYLTCDHRLMIERPEAVLRGVRIVLHAVGAERAYLGVEANKQDAVDRLRELADDGVEVMALEVKYPQGAEKMLIRSVLRREVPTGKLPLDVEILVVNVATCAALADSFDGGLAVIERIVTVGGPGVRRPRNLLVPLGTPISALLARCGGLTPEARQVVLGGPMMGQAQKTLDVPTLKGTSGVLAFTDVVVAAREEHPCIRCGRCLEACPMFLDPSRLAKLTRVERPDELEAAHLMSCFECASCSYVCPSNIPLVQWMRRGKVLVRQQQQKAQARAKAKANP